jgi:hypothetical protein
MCPSYTFKDLNSGEEVTTIMSMNEREEFVANNPHMQQVIHSAPAIGDSIRLGLKKPDNGFRDRLKEIKKAHSRGFTKSTVNTW